ncbi:hypothetical protein V6N13_128407 [Hibiscus sabdariffa]|uniref:Caffeoyl-CoA O-methyltransferase n=1 Tax=Hibiscus sabdariffa TaxID=183260 RepID=A0ABR2P107_9ROSI
MAAIFATSHCSASASQSAKVHLSSPRRFHLLSSRAARPRCIKLNNLTRNCSHSSNDAPLIVTDDEKFSNKQVISITPRLYDYILANVREPPILQQLREETANMSGSEMQGYSSLVIALALPESGKCETWTSCSADVLKSLISNGETCSYDFAFVDAEKRMNQEYFELLLQLVRVGGVIVIDNVLWFGKVAYPLVNDATTVSIRDFNKKTNGGRASKHQYGKYLLYHSLTKFSVEIFSSSMLMNVNLPKAMI